MKLEKNTTLLFTGDSVTDCGRTRPLGEGNGGQLGTGYVSIIKALLEAYHPEAGMRILNTGISGNRARDLKARWQSDILAYNPQYVSIMVGINDVWHQFTDPYAPVNIVTLEDYTKDMEYIINESLNNGVKKVILITPFYIEPNEKDDIKVMLVKYADAVRALAKKYGCILVDSQAVFDKVCEKKHSYFYSADRVHPNQIGHTVLAKAFLEAINAEVHI